MDRFLERLPSLETLLWILASLVALVVVLLFVPSLLAPAGGTETPVARVIYTPTATLTRTPTLTLAAAVADTTRLPVTVPTPAGAARTIVVSADLQRTGWIVTGDANPHFGDRNLHSGAYQAQTFQSLIYFDLSELAPGTKIQFAEVELNGLSRNNLGTTGSWSLKFLPTALLANWNAHTSGDFVNATDQGRVGSPLGPADLMEGQINQFALSPDQLTLIEGLLGSVGRVAFRLEGPSGSEQSLFTWDAGDRDPAVGVRPVLRLIALPAQFTFVTNTPTPENVLTAAAQLQTGTAYAQRYGTPTPFPRGYATVPPNIIVTPLPTAANRETEIAMASYATAIAVTTGTFTPTPLNWVTAAPTPTQTPTATATPTPPFVAVGSFTPIPVINPTPTEVSLLLYPKTRIPPETGLIGKITFATNREGGELPQYWVVDNQGVMVGKLTSIEYYRIALVHDLFSPDYQYHVDVEKDDRGLWRIVLYDVKKGVFAPLIQEDLRAGGIGVYHPAWSPIGNKIAFVSERTGNSEIYVYDIDTKATTRVTNTVLDPVTKEWSSNKHPTWSPDGKQIMFSSNRPNIARWQLWIMDANGNNLRSFAPSLTGDWDPVWIKR